VTAAAAPPRYLDPVAFTQLFHQRRRNHREICEALHVLTRGVAARFWFASPHDRDDAVGDVALYAIQRIDRFKLTRGQNAFSYYTSLIYRRILRQIRDGSRLRGRAMLFRDLYKPGNASGTEAGKHRSSDGLEFARPYAHAV
jgi:DNA-directed RNA polymerase specialized sigma24 family protein